ncbi:MAG: AAA family ATPase [Lachnospiraceae bacterium]|nr:AAA family ATPase [Lachnospiraceae bacterium]
MNISVAIADVNRDYLERLVEVLEDYEDLSVSMFTNADRLEQALQTKRFDIVLFDPDISEKKISFYNTKLSMCLYSEEARNAGLYADCDKVIKYQRVSKIYKEVIKAYADKAGYLADFDNSQRTKILAVYSPIGGCGKTTIALALANKLSAYGKNVLFLSMEQLDSSSLVNAHTEETEGITVLIESAGENASFQLKLKGIIKKGFNNISYIEGFERFVDYNTVSQEEMFDVVDKIRKCGSCDVVVVDMQSSMDGIGKAVFEQADNIVVVDRSGELPSRKMDMFAQQALVREYAGKMCKISNLVEGNVKASNILSVPDIGSVHNYGNQPLKNIIQLISAKDTIDMSLLMK